MNREEFYAHMSRKLVDREIRRLHLAGWSVVEIADRFEVSAYQIESLLRLYRKLDDAE